MSVNIRGSAALSSSGPPVLRSSMSALPFKTASKRCHMAWASRHKMKLQRYELDASKRCHVAWASRPWFLVPYYSARRNHGRDASAGKLRPRPHQIRSNRQHATTPRRETEASAGQFNGFLPFRGVVAVQFIRLSFTAISAGFQPARGNQLSKPLTQSFPSARKPSAVFFTAFTHQLDSGRHTGLPWW